MASNIDENFPIAGIDQPSQGFRDNFLNAKLEIEALQTDVVALQGSVSAIELNDLSDVNAPTPASNDVLVWNGSVWEASPTPGLVNVVEDSTPQLGGDLDVNGNEITNSAGDFIDITDELRVFGSTTNTRSDLISYRTGASDRVSFRMRRGRGSFASPAAVQSGDSISNIEARSAFNTSGDEGIVFSLETFATETHSASSQGVSTLFRSTANGFSSRANRIEFTSQGQLRFNSVCGLYVLSETTTDNSATELLINGNGGSRLVLEDDTTWFFRVSVAARRTDANDESAAYVFEGAIDRNSGVATTALVGTVDTQLTKEDTPAWDVTVDADTTNGALRIVAQGENAKTISWIAKVETVEVTG